MCYAFEYTDVLSLNNHCIEGHRRVELKYPLRMLIQYIHQLTN